MKKFFVIIGVILINALSLICYLEYKTIEEAKEQNIITKEITIEQN